MARNVLKFNKYVNYLNSNKLGVCTNKDFNHTMNKEEVYAAFKNFYSHYKDFCVDENNRLTEALNLDYELFEKWILDG